MVIADNQDEAWCVTNFLSHASLRLAVVIRAELLEVMQRIELPVSPPAFGCQDNCTNIKRALISGFFLKVNSLISVLYDKNVISCCFLPSLPYMTLYLYYIIFVSILELLSYYLTMTALHGATANVLVLPVWPVGVKTSSSSKSGVGVERRLVSINRLLHKLSSDDSQWILRSLCPMCPSHLLSI